MDTSAIVSYYVNLLAVQYHMLPRAMATIQALATEVVADQIVAQVQNGYNLFPANGYPAAIGAQLDVIGEYVGAPRTIFGYDPSIPYFALYSYITTPPSNVGFAPGVYTDLTIPSIPDNWLSYSTGETSYVLTDGQLQLLIAYLIAVHASGHTISEIDGILQTFFGSYCTLTDNFDMSIVYTHQAADPNFLFSIVAQIGALPHPAGVGITVVEV